MLLFGSRKSKVKTYDHDTQEPVIRASICNGEQVAGFKDIHTGKFEEVYPSKPFLKEFVLKPKEFPGYMQQRLEKAGFFAALDTEEGYVSFCVTEKRSKEEIDQLVKVIKEG